MVLAVDITLNAYSIIAIAIVCFVIGFLGKAAKLRNVKTSLEKLEKQMLSDHSEILRLQKELAEKDALLHPKAPIVQLRDNIGTEANKEKMPDSGLRKTGNSKSSS